eukprot:Pgem_evm1s1888
MKVSRREAYQILEIDANADENEIRKSYKKKALFYHPDKNSSPGRFPFQCYTFTPLRFTPL